LPDATAASTITAARATVEKIPASVSTKAAIHTFPAKPPVCEAGSHA